MKFVVEEKDKAEEKKLALRLVNDLNRDGTVILVATDNDGKQWTLMVLENGRYGLIGHIPDNFGIDVDLHGRIMKL